MIIICIHCKETFRQKNHEKRCKEHCGVEQRKYRQVKKYEVQY